MGKGAELLEAIRREKPLVHHITNNVTVKDCADITLSIGALPVMAHALEEVEEMVQSARAAVVNIGTLSSEQVEAMVLMGKKAAQRGIPLVLDPVGAGATTFRTGAAQKILTEVNPALIKGNAAEIATLAGVKEARISGVESLAAGTDPLEAARTLSRSQGRGAVVAVTGKNDLVTDGKRAVRIFNGHPLLAQIVGSGCMAASLAAAFAAVEPDYFWAAAYALALLGVAGEMAAETPGLKGAAGPAEYRNVLLDTVFLISNSSREFDRKAVLKVE